jgi:hypothetical protein
MSFTKTTLKSSKFIFLTPLFIPSVQVRPLVHLCRVQYNYVKQCPDEKYSSE